jgi:oligoribonuclease NrnB/cAMP/cGMP phosphodiesterase (DHH superfamily)
MKPLVLFHASCNDGFCAAWIYRRFVNPECEFRAVQYGWEPPAVDDREVVILDFSFERALLLEMQERARSLLVLDHHQTAAADLEGLDFCVFDLSKSGARLTWEHFFDPQASASIDIPPWLVDYTEDKDLWRWNLPDSRAINATLESYPRLFHIWDGIARRSPEELAIEGKAILRFQDRLIRPRVKNHSWAHIGGFQVPVTNSTGLSSEIGNRMAQGHPFAAVFFIRPDGKVVYNLRSTGDEAIDVSEIAHQYGGGGHKNAAGFTIDTMIPMEVQPPPDPS